MHLHEIIQYKYIALVHTVQGNIHKLFTDKQLTVVKEWDIVRLLKTKESVPV